MEILYDFQIHALPLVSFSNHNIYKEASVNICNEKISSLIFILFKKKKKKKKVLSLL